MFNFLNEYKVKLNNETQSFEDGLTIYSNDYFCPKNFVDDSLNLTSNTHTIHWFNGSWHTKEQRFKRKMWSLKKKLKIFMDI